MPQTLSFFIPRGLLLYNLLVANVFRFDEGRRRPHTALLYFGEQIMAQRFPLTVLCLVIALAGCGGNNRNSSLVVNPEGMRPISHDLTTPEGAILCLEDAYRAKDIEAAVRCKDFTIEAKLMLQNLEQDMSDDAEILSKTAEVLELGFRSEMKNSGFPDFRGIESKFPFKQPYQGRDDIVEITEICQHVDGTKTTNKLVVAKTDDGWKVVAVPD